MTYGQQVKMYVEVHGMSLEEARAEVGAEQVDEVMQGSADYY
jgi:hypothetical protein